MNVVKQKQGVDPGSHALFLLNGVDVYLNMNFKYLSIMTAASARVA